MVSLIKKKDDITKKINSILDRTKAGRTFLQNVIYPIYQNMQMERWETKNASQGSAWSDVSPGYAAYKKRRYGGGTKYRFIGGQGEGRPWVANGSWPSYPGSGNKLMIATGRLFGSVVGPKVEKLGFDTKDHRKIVTDTKIHVYTVTPYAQEVASKRAFMEFSRESKSRMKAEVVEFINGNRRGL